MCVDSIADWCDQLQTLYEGGLRNYAKVSKQACGIFPFLRKNIKCISVARFDAWMHAFFCQNLLARTVIPHFHTGAPERILPCAFHHQSTDISCISSSSSYREDRKAIFPVLLTKYLFSEIQRVEGWEEDYPLGFDQPFLLHIDIKSSSTKRVHHNSCMPLHMRETTVTISAYSWMWEWNNRNTSLGRICLI